MSTEQRAHDRLVAANPLVDVSPYVPTLDEAMAFLSQIEELDMSTDTTEKLKKPEQRPRTTRRGLLVAAGVFAAILGIVGVVALLANDSDERPGPATTVTTVVPSTSEPPTTSATVAPADPVAEAIAAVESAIAAWNAADIEAYIAAFHPDAEEVQREPWGYGFEILMNANRHVDVTEPCEVTQTSPPVVECSIISTGDWDGPPGFLGASRAVFELDESNLIIVWHDGVDCCDEQFDFNRQFWSWIQKAYPAVYADITPADPSALPGWRTDPADMSIAIQYVDEFIAQTENYPIQARPTLAFTGDACTYSGASAFSFDANQRFRWTNTAEGELINLVWWRVPDGTTVADVETAGGIDAFATANPEGTDTVYWYDTGTTREAGELLYRLNEPGTWLINCFQDPGNGEGDFEAVATVFEVNQP